MRPWQRQVHRLQAQPTDPTVTLENLQVTELLYFTRLEANTSYVSILTTSLPSTGSPPTCIGCLTQCRNALGSRLISTYPGLHGLSILLVILKNTLYDSFRVI